MTTSSKQLESSSRSRASARLNTTLEKNLAAYVAAATAAGVSLLALSKPAEGKIVYTKTHEQISPNTKYQLDLNNNGTADFTLSNISYANEPSLGAGLYIARPAGNSVRGFSSGFGKSFRHFASALPAGVKIQAGKRFKASNSVMAFTYLTTFYVANGQWLNATNRFLGLKFVISGGTHYGWARLSTNCANLHCSELLTGYAYETVANKSIVTGKTNGPDVVAVQDASLGHLARGPSAVPAWRRRNSVAANH